MVKVLGDKEYDNFNRVRRIEMLLYQIILIAIYDKSKDFKEYKDRLYSAMQFAEDVDMKIKDLDIKEIKALVYKRKEYITSILSFYEKHKMFVFPLYLSLEKSMTCTGFAFRILNKYSCYDFNHVVLKNKKIKSFDSKFYEFINGLEKKNILYKIELLSDLEPGDIVIYGKNPLEYNHIGLVYDKDLNILSKFGLGFLYLTPYNIGYFKGELRVLKVNDPQYYKNFKEKFLPIIDRVKLDKTKFLSFLDKILKENR